MARSCRASRTDSMTAKPPATFSSTDSIEAFLPATARAARNSSGSTLNWGNAATRTSAMGLEALHDLQRRHGVASLRSIEKIDALHVHGNVATAKFGKHLIAVDMGAVQHCDVVRASSQAAADAWLRWYRQRISLPACGPLCTTACTGKACASAGSSSRRAQPNGSRGQPPSRNSLLAISGLHAIA